MACDVLRHVWESTEHDDGFVSLEVMPDLAHDTEATLEQARDYWQRVDRPNLMIKIPGTDAGAARDRDRRSPRASTSTSRCCSRSRPTRRWPRRSSAGSSGARRTASRSTSTRSRRSSSRASTPRSTSGSRSSAAATCSAPPRSPTRAPPTCASRRSSTASASPSCARPARRCSARCGRRPASRTRTTPTRCTSTSCRAGHGQHDADADAARVRRARRGAAARPPTSTAERGRAASSQALADAGIDMNDVTDKLLARRRASLFEDAMDKLHRGRRVAARGGRDRPPADDRVGDPRRARADDRRAHQEGRRGGGRRSAIWRKDPTLWGGAGHARDRQPARLADDLRVDARARRRAASSSPRRCADDGLTDVVLLGMGGSSLAPEVFRRSFGEHRRRAASCTCSTRPTPRAIRAAERRDRPVEDAVPRLVEVGRDDRDAVAVQVLPRARDARRSATTTPARTSSRSPTRAASSAELADEHDFRARVPERPGHRRPLLGAVVLRARARRR